MHGVDQKKAVTNAVTRSKRIRLGALQLQVEPLNQASTYRSLTLRSNPLCLGSAFVVGLEVASATARSTRYAERPPSDRE